MSTADNSSQLPIDGTLQSQAEPWVSPSHQQSLGRLWREKLNFFHVVSRLCLHLLGSVVSSSFLICFSMNPCCRNLRCLPRQSVIGAGTLEVGCGEHGTEQLTKHVQFYRCEKRRPPLRHPPPTPMSYLSYLSERARCAARNIPRRKTVKSLEKSKVQLENINSLFNNPKRWHWQSGVSFAFLLWKFSYDDSRRLDKIKVKIISVDIGKKQKFSDFRFFTLRPRANFVRAELPRLFSAK